MFGLLHQYLVEKKSLYLRGMGQLQVVTQPASFDVANQVLNGPHHTICLQENQQAGSLQPLIAFISRQLDIAEEHAFSLYESFCNQLHQNIENRQQVTWHHVGTFKKDGSGKTVFVADSSITAYNDAVPASRIIRKNEAHNMVVGTMETTNTAMREMLTVHATEETVPAGRWWIGALVLGAIAIALIVLKKMQVL